MRRGIGILCVILHVTPHVAPAGAVPAPDSTAAALRIFQFDDLQHLPDSDRADAYTAYVVALRQALADSAATRAVAMAERATNLWPDRQRPYLHLAAAQLQAKQWGRSIAAARLARQRQQDALPPEPLAWEGAAAADYWEGLGMYQTQRFDEAMPLLRRAHAADPAWAEAARALGQAEFVDGDYAAAKRAYARAYEIDAHIGDVRDLSYYSTAIASSGDLDGGIAAMQAAVRRYPYAPGLHASLGNMLEQEGNLTGSYYEYTMELLVHGLRGRFSTNALESAGEILDRANPGKDADHELQLLSLGMNSLRQGDMHHAVHTFRHLLDISSTPTPLPRLLLAEALLGIGNAAAARDELETYLQSEPDFAPALFLLAQTYTALGDAERAAALRARAKQLFPGFWKFEAEPRG
jgi:tetratricopeptide (TPR) repeat protein